MDSQNQRVFFSPCVSACKHMTILSILEGLNSAFKVFYDISYRFLLNNYIYTCICSAGRLETFVDSLTTGIATTSCSSQAAASLQSAISYVTSLRQECCPLEIPVPEGVCSLAEVKNCLEEYGEFQALASPFQSVCE